MAIFRHGKTWWFEYRRRKPQMRVVKNTGFRIDEADGEKKAQDVFNAFKIGLRSSARREAMEGILAAIYGIVKDDDAFPLDSLWTAYEDWCSLKCRRADDSKGNRKRSLVRAFVRWATDRKLTDVGQVNVLVTREYVKILRYAGASTKTLRNKIAELSQVWNAIGEIHQSVKNPWKAVRPDDDGSSIRRAAFSSEEIGRVLAECRRSGHDWYLASMIALYTGLRYGDVARLDWKDVDMGRGVITVTPSKTKKSSGVTVTIPIASPLRDALDADGRERRGFVLPEHGIRYGSCNHLPLPFREVLRRAGIEGEAYTFHSWRHTANTRMAEAGVPSAVRQMICGWTSDAMARHYDHAKHLKELAEAVGKI